MRPVWTQTVVLLALAACAVDDGHESVSGAAVTGDQESPTTAPAVEVEMVPGMDGVAELGVRDPSAVALENQQAAADRALRSTPEYRLNWLAKDANLIAYARVTAVTGRIDDSGDTPVVTDVSLQGGSVLWGSGAVPNNITVGGGVVAGVRYVDTSSPVLVEGEEFLAFLANLPNGEWILIEALPSTDGAVEVNGTHIDAATLSAIFGVATSDTGGNP